ncbi:hypothetical protein EYF80_050082 [Liparis tanakae]|uniref:Uncharacterized protein n=1 Tax=Liparis tanakae TaxID=230148 RepID=A0A4Z2FFS7_9TELE|nr:hypothetical protein EYF80_050082 [Liparis tanakae]
MKGAMMPVSLNTNHRSPPHSTRPHHTPQTPIPTSPPDPPYPQTPPDPITFPRPHHTPQTPIPTSPPDPPYPQTPPDHITFPSPPRPHYIPQPPQPPRHPSPHRACGLRGLTTEVLSPDITGSWTSRQLAPSAPQAEISVMTRSGSVAVFTSDSPLAHAAELTSHRKENTAVTPRGQGSEVRGQGSGVGWRTYDQRALVVLLVLVVEEDVDAQRRRGVEEGEHAHGDKELRRGRVVAHEEEALAALALTGTHLKGYSKSTWMLRSLSVRFLHSTAMRNIPE